MNQETANKIITLTVLKRMVARLDAEVRAAADMDPGDRKAGRADGRPIGYVTLTAPAAAFRVTDGEAFRAWVKATRPDEIVYVESVRSSYEKAVLETGCDQNGEAIPGVELVPGNPVMQVRPTPDAEDAIRAELAAGGLTFAAVIESLEITP